MASRTSGPGTDRPPAWSDQPPAWSDQLPTTAPGGHGLRRPDLGGKVQSAIRLPSASQWAATFLLGCTRGGSPGILG